MANIFSLLLFITLFTPIFTQMCREYSQTCSDNYACCGGCCLKGICRDTYVDCRLGVDPCTIKLCPPNEECYIHQAKDCGGCGPTTQCRSVTVPTTPEKHPDKNNTVENKSSKLCVYLLDIVVLSMIFLSFVIKWRFTD